MLVTSACHSPVQFQQVEKSTPSLDEEDPGSPIVNVVDPGRGREYGHVCHQSTA